MINTIHISNLSINVVEQPHKCYNPIDWKNMVKYYMSVRQHDPKETIFVENDKICYHCNDKQVYYYNKNLKKGYRPEKEL